MGLSVLLLTGCNTTHQDTLPPYADKLLGAVYKPPTQIKDFTAQSTLGKPFTLSEHQGEIVLLFFGYLTCPDFCPLTLSEMRQVYAALGESVDKVNVVFVTIDPERDSLDTMSRYMARFHPDFIGIREEGESLQNLMNQFGAIAEKQAPTHASGVYLVDHTASIFLIDANGKLLVQYLYGTDYRDIVHDLELMLAQ